MWRLKMDETNVIVKFGGNIDSVDINTFTRTVLGYASAMQAACGDIDASQALDIRIGETRPGCLEVDLKLVTDSIKGMIDFASAAAPILPQVVATATELYKLLSFLGKNGKEETATIESGKNRVTVVASNAEKMTVNQNTYNIYTGNPDATKSIVNSFKELESRPEIESLEIIDPKPEGAHFKADRDDFQYMAAAPLYEGADTKTVISTEQPLSLLKVVLRKSTKSMWRFGWNGVPISANISDNDFFDHFSDYSFGIGDVLIADMKITKRYNRDLNTYMNERYEIVKVHDKKTAPKNQPLI